jgi:8-oxo-dGTP pyrophosphatase MutT (NUDIX family)
MTDLQPSAAADSGMAFSAGGDAAAASPDTQAANGGPSAGAIPKAGEKKKRRNKKPIEEHRVYEAGGVIVCDGKVVLRLTDKQRWIFPKGKLKKHESAEAAAVREAIEETGLDVEVVDEVADLLIKHEGKKRRFVFYLMRATAKTWDWPHHEGRDTFLITPDRVRGLLKHDGYASVWAASEARARAMCDDPTPFVAHRVQRPEA